jgi:predicted Fe-Mo cluster-binding NifX family protein
MGARAVQKLNEKGIQAYMAAFSTVDQLLAHFEQGGLQQITPHNACNQHSCH